MSLEIFLILFPALFLPSSLVHGQYFTSGECPKGIKPMRHFNFQKYKGLWFEVEKSLFLPEISGKCIYVRYKDLKPDGVSFSADIVQIQYGTMKKIPTPSAGKIISHDGSAQISLMVNVLIPMTNIPLAAFKYPYWILETDYDDYSIKWACEEFTLITGAVVNMQSIWILSRTREYPADLREYVHNRLREFGLQPELLLPTDHINCPPPPADDYLEEPIEVVPPPPDLIPVPLRKKSNATEESVTANT